MVKKARSFSVQGSGPFSAIGWIARTLGTQDSNEIRYETFPWICVKRFRYNGCDVICCNQFHEPKLWPNPCNSHVMSHCLCLFHMCMEVLCQGFWVEALPGSTSWSLSLKRCRKLSVWKSLRSFQLGTQLLSFQLRDLPQATQRRRPPRIWPPSREQPSVGGLRTETSIIAGAISAHIYLTRHIASKWVGSCYCWSPIIQTKAWKPTISLVLLQLSRQEKLWSRPGWNIMK